MLGFRINGDDIEFPAPTRNKQKNDCFEESTHLRTISAVTTKSFSQKSTYSIYLTTFSYKQFNSFLKAFAA